MAPFVPESSMRRTGRVASERRTKTIGKPGNAESCSGSARSQRDMRPFHAGAHRAGFIETEQAVDIVDQHVEVFEESPRPGCLECGAVPCRFWSSYTSTFGWGPHGNRLRAGPAAHYEADWRDPALATTAAPRVSK